MDEVTILVANDNPDQLLLTRMVLRKAGHRVVTAENGREALEACMRERPAVVVSDVMMPEMDGIEFTRALRADPALSDTPVLLASALRKDTRSVVEGLEAGADAYVEIPYDPIRLTATIARLVERKLHADEVRALNERLEEKVRERTALLEEANRELALEVAERRRVETELARARDAAVESARLKSEFLANVSHEVRTPMHAVLGMSDLLLGTDLSRKQREFAEAIRESAGALLSVINDVLDFSKIDAGKFRLDRVEFDLTEVIEGCVYMFAERARAKGVGLSYALHEGVPETLRGDPGRLRQVLTNLVGNAVKFTSAGEVRVEVSAERTDDGYAAVRFEVSDTGVGIEPDALTRIFQPFAQADGSTTREYGGTGLGLAISKSLAELMGGEVGVESRPGEGSLFWFTALFECARAGDLAKAREDLKGLRALVVDANGPSRDPLARQLDGWGVRTEEAEDAEKALDMLRDAEAAGDPFDFALVECHLPGAGPAALARLARNDGRSRTRLVLVADVASARDCEARGADLFDATLTVPLRRQHLFESLLEVVNGRAARAGREPKQEAPPPPGGRGGESRLLVAEDNAVNRRLMENMLEDLGYEADFVADGASALQAAAGARYALILMDCHMPALDGFTAAREIRRAEAPGRRTPIIALTADAMRGTREKCLDAGMDDYLSKPFSPEQLSGLIRKWLDGDEARGAAEAGAAAEDADGHAHTVAGAINPTLFARIEGPHADGRVSALVDEFAADAQSRCAAMHGAVARSDWEGLRREAHALKGSASFLGALRLADLCARLVEHASRADAASARAALANLDAEVSDARRELRELAGGVNTETQRHG